MLSGLGPRTVSEGVIAKYFHSILVCLHVCHFVNIVIWGLIKGLRFFIS